MPVKLEIDFDTKHEAHPRVTVFFSGDFYWPAEMDNLLRVLTEAREWLLKQKEREVGEPL